MRRESTSATSSHLVYTYIVAPLRKTMHRRFFMSFLCSFSDSFKPCTLLARANARFQDTEISLRTNNDKAFF